ncbi:MAG: hypothetical protein E7346_00335 [Clostridiales bacterium]|nr:hypothetical protein [Clostridiales bacterium]
MQSKNKEQTIAPEKERAQYIEDLIREVEEDFEERRQERYNYERQWELNMNFLSGNQYCDVNSRGEITSEDKTFFWQNHRVYNHIAPIIESRLAKFSRIQPTVSVRPKSDDDKEVAAAQTAEMIISGAFKRAEVESVVKKTTAWSETCGTGFYKIVWNNHGGDKIGELDGEPVYEGDVSVIAVSPFEIFPDSLYSGDIKDCNSIIHARAMTVGEIATKYGVAVVGEEVGIFNLNKPTSNARKKSSESTLKNAAIVIERYERPCKQFPLGRLTTVCNGTLLFTGDLPYLNGENGERGFPFVKQVSNSVTGSFFGSSVIERLIPIQRAFNAVKNRKHEFLNRLSMGVMTVEDGSVDVDDLAEDGLSPGKILVYRQGAKAPELMSDKTMPDDFNTEEDKLINEFVIVSGVSDVSSSSTNASLTSGSALEILVEQDNSRLLATADDIRRCYVEIAKQTIRLFSQFTEGVRAVRYSDENNKTKVFYADERAVKSDDVYLENENELLYTHSQKKDMIFKLYESGLLTDEQGKLRTATKEKILSLLGYKDLDYQKGIARLQEEKAQRENERALKEEIFVEEIDDDLIHVDEHVRYVLSEYNVLDDQQKTRFYTHIKEHKERAKESVQNKENIEEV